MKLIKQPKNSDLCGQCCVAMVTGLSLRQVIRLMGRNGTFPEEILTALFLCGKCCSRPKKLGRNKQIPGNAIVAIDNHERGHWVLFWDGVWYDPGLGDLLPDGWKITHYLLLH